MRKEKFVVEVVLHRYSVEVDENGNESDMEDDDSYEEVSDWESESMESKEEAKELFEKLTQAAE